jgi:hypothetical protein
MKNHIKEIFSYCLLISLAILIDQCKKIDRFYRPDLPEVLCAVGIIDIDDTINYYMWNYPNSTSTTFACNIHFENSTQKEYSDGSTDSLREFSFLISNYKKEEIYRYQSKQALRNPDLTLPGNLMFESGKKYFFQADEYETASVSAESIVPELPPELSLLSLKTGINILDLPKEGCYYDVRTGGYINGISTFTRRFAEIELSFPNYYSTSCYAILLTGSYSDTNWGWSPGWGSNLLNFEVLESSTNGFLYPLQGRTTFERYCKEYNPYSFGDASRPEMLNAYFIDGSKIHGANCTLKISTKWDWIKFQPGFIKCFRIRLMSIPKEAYLFYKSLYTYKVQLNDPFSELVNINGNIVGGNGVIAICRSRELIVYTGQTGGYYDTFF